MLDKYKDKNEFYSLVGIKCYSYVPSLLNHGIFGALISIAFCVSFKRYFLVFKKMFSMFFIINYLSYLL
ncbi:hypothetical protein [Spiroplasma endosymbiont of Tipula paludosa]|uniref:hypothetical protein n=1 Tax=Spiroplasma endosymbiont of Tipula paludosa TaxID=3066295 RepID=UPI0035C9189D